LVVATCDAVWAAQARPTIPNSALPGREREQLFGKPGPQPGVPQIEWWGGQPRPVIEQPRRTKPAKRSKRRSPQR
jgi:hypothetical protein